MPTRSIPWPRILAEGVAIVVSILLAFGIQAWWEEAQEREEEQELLAAIHQDLVTNQDVLAENISDVEMQQRQLQDIVAMTSETLSALPDSVDASVLWGLTRPWTTELVFGSLDATTGSGKLSLIRDAAVRASLVGLTKVDADLDEPRSYLARITVDGTHAINRHPDLAEQLSVTGPSRKLASSSLARVRSDREVMAFVTDKILTMNAYLVQSRSLLEDLREAARLVEAEMQAGSQR